MSDVLDFERHRIRLRLLQAIAEQATGSWTLAMLCRKLELLGYRKSEDYVLNQLRWLESDAGAVTIVRAGEEVAVGLRKPGREHVNRVRVLAGVEAPEDEG